MNDSLDGLKELRKALIPKAVIYCGERVEIKISKDERHIEQSPGETSFRLASSGGVVPTAHNAPSNSL